MIAKCPYCDSVAVCKHFIGWIGPRSLITVRGGLPGAGGTIPKLDGDYINSELGRVYRKGGMDAKHAGDVAVVAEDLQGQAN